MKGRQYREMQHAAKLKLTGRLPDEIAKKANIKFDGHHFLLVTLGDSVQIDWPELKTNASIGMWHWLTILQYMAEADGYPMSDAWIGLPEFKEGGFVRGTSFDRENNRFLQKGIGNQQKATILEAAAKLGGTHIPGKADVSLIFSFLPNFPLQLNLWLEDEDFPASGKVLCNASAEHYLRIEAAGTAAGILLHRLEKEIENVKETVH